MNRKFLRILSATMVLSVVLLAGISSPARAWLFSPIQINTGTGLLKFKIDFSILQDIKSFQQKYQFNTLALKKTSASCKESSAICEREYRRCLGLVKYNDQESSEVLFRLKNACINSCSEPEECFGLDLSSGQVPLVKKINKDLSPICSGPQTASCQTDNGLAGTKEAISCDAMTGQWNFGVCEPNPIQECEGPSSRACTTVLGQSGTQHGTCNTQTGQYEWGTCVPHPQVLTCPGIAPSCPVGYSGSYTCQNGQWVNNCTKIVFEVQCSSNQPQCPVGYAGNYTCQNGQWINNCYQPTCSGSAPPCPAGYNGFYVCQNGQWVNRCQQVKSCPIQDSDWKVCIMPDGGYGREYIDYCNQETGQWVWKSCKVYPDLQPVCTSFTYSDWDDNACRLGSHQTRNILTRLPYGCAGGSPVTTQSCCNLEQPSCPSGWSGSYTCYSKSWSNTCVPPSPQYCYRGVKYRMDSGKVYTTTVGKYMTGIRNGQSCNQPYNASYPETWGTQFSSESSFKGYVDNVYQSLPNSCDPSFVYSQCQ